MIEQLAADVTGGDESELRDLASRTVDYIHDVVWSELGRNAGDLRPFSPLVEAAGELDELDIFTLNHDLLIEEALGRAGLGHADGFEQHWGDVAIWTDTFTRPGPRLLKLHGSLDWLRLWVEDRPGGRQAAVRRVSGDMYHLKGPDGESLEFPADGRPQFLAGTFNKVLDYASGIYAEQHYRFNERMRALDRLVVSGYGFGDKAVNSRLIGWLARRPENRLIIIHPDPEGLRARARPAIQRSLRRPAEAGQFVIVDKGFQEVDWPTIQELLDPSNPSSDLRLRGENRHPWEARTRRLRLRETGP